MWMRTINLRHLWMSLDVVDQCHPRRGQSVSGIEFSQRPTGISLRKRGTASAVSSVCVVSSLDLKDVRVQHRIPIFLQLLCIR